MPENEALPQNWLPNIRVCIAWPLLQDNVGTQPAVSQLCLHHCGNSTGSNFDNRPTPSLGGGGRGEGTISA